LKAQTGERTTEELLEVKPEFAGFQNTGYPGAFPPRVEERIRKLVGSPSLHLFSGRSKVGEVRVDLTRPEATINCDVRDFIKHDNRNWAWVILDPPYDLKDPRKKLAEYADFKSVAANVPLRRAIEEFIQSHAENVLWFDLCSPKPDGFFRQATWMYLPGGYHNVRALTWLKREGERLD
jgi:hypothetical protein